MTDTISTISTVATATPTLPITTTVLLTIISAFIGTFAGAFFLNRMQNDKIKKVRELTIKSLKLFKKYKSQPFNNAANEFNTSFKIAEKRAFLVCLHKLGIPIEMPANGLFDIKEIRFSEKAIDEDEISGIIVQIDNKHCDHLFFMDVETYFTADERIKSIRNIAKKYVLEVFKQSSCDFPSKTITHPDNWTDKFSIGESNILSVFTIQTASTKYFNKPKGDTNDEQISQLVKEIEQGIWDNYLQWDYDAYQNMMAQKKSAEMVTNLFSNATIPTQDKLNSTQNNIPIEK